MAFEQYLSSGEERRRPGKWRALTYSISILFHGGLLVAALIRSFWHVDELQPPGVQVMFMARNLTPPPPPPPPLAKKTPAATVKPKVPVPVKPKVAALVQPVEVKPDPPSHDEPEGSSDGVEGGSADGVAGGVVAQAPPPPPPPPKPKEDPKPVMLPPNVGQGYRVTDINDPRYRPSLPPALRRAGMMVWGLFRICVSTEGHVSEVKVLKSADSLVDDDWLATIRRWEYRPYSLDGRNIPFCHAARISVTAQL